MLQRMQKNDSAIRGCKRMSRLYSELTIRMKIHGLVKDFTVSLRTNMV